MFDNRCGTAYLKVAKMNLNQFCVYLHLTLLLLRGAPVWPLLEGEGTPYVRPGKHGSERGR